MIGLAAQNLGHLALEIGHRYGFHDLKNFFILKINFSTDMDLEHLLVYPGIDIINLGD